MITYTSSERGRAVVPPITDAKGISPFPFKVVVKIGDIEVGWEFNVVDPLIFANRYGVVIFVGYENWINEQNVVEFAFLQGNLVASKGMRHWSDSIHTAHAKFAQSTIYIYTTQLFILVNEFQYAYIQHPLCILFEEDHLNCNIIPAQQNLSSKVHVDVTKRRTYTFSSSIPPSCTTFLTTPGQPRQQRCVWGAWQRSLRPLQQTWTSFRSASICSTLFCLRSLLGIWLGALRIRMVHYQEKRL